jgi:plastocyanin
MNCRAAAVGLACAASAIALPSTAAARTHMVWAGGTSKFQKTLKARLGGEVNDFFPHQVTIHQGDTVQWQGMSIGFHNVDFPKRGSGDLPFIVPIHTPIGGLTDFAGNPFWFNGQSNLGFNPQLFAASGGGSFDGSARADSGLPVGKPVPFKLTFTKPGTYVYFCDLHYGMRGVVVVVPRSAKTPTPAQEADAIAAQQSRATRTAKALARTRVDGKVSVGVSGAGGVDVLAMFPRTVRVHVGSTLTFATPPDSGETHTVTFGPANYLRPLETSIAGPTPTATAVYPSSESGPIPVPGTHGNGFANSGALDRGDDAPFKAQATFRFTAAGTYHYVCLTHPFMQGTIIVSGAT